MAHLHEFIYPRMDDRRASSSGLLALYSTIFFGYICPTLFPITYYNISPNRIGGSMLLATQNPLYSFRKITDLLKDQKEQARSTMGLLIDATAPIYREKDKDYIVELKLVDDTVNELQPYGVMVKYMSVFVFSPEPQAVDFCDQIGQVILLDKFIFRVWHKIRFETKYLSRTEQLQCFEVEENKLHTRGFLSNARIAKEATETIHIRALQLHEWFHAYFIKDYKPLLGVSLVNNYTIMAEPFNFILRSL